MVGLTGVISMERKEGGGIVEPTLPLQLKTVKESSIINRQFANFIVWLFLVKIFTKYAL